MHHFVQVGASGSPGVPAKVLAVPDPRRGTKHQELQVPALAEPAELQQVSRAGCFVFSGRPVQTVGLRVSNVVSLPLQTLVSTIITAVVNRNVCGSTNLDISLMM